MTAETDTTHPYSVPAGLSKAKCIPEKPKYIPDIMVSRPRSAASTAHLRSCWSPETCQSDETNESEYDDNEEGDGNTRARGDKGGFHTEGSGDDTIHAPQIKRTSAVFARAAKIESVYQR